MEFSKPEHKLGSLAFLQGIFPTQGSNQDLLHCRQILYDLSYQGSPLTPSLILSYNNGFLFASCFASPKIFQEPKANIQAFKEFDSVQPVGQIYL